MTDMIECFNPYCSDGIDQHYHLPNEEQLRPDWDEYFLRIAETVALRADCTRRQVGAVIVDIHHRIISTGYNGAPSGGKSCLRGECPRGQMSKEQIAPGSSYDTGAGSCIALHAEQNAIMYASWDQRQGATIYITCEPCEGCARMIAGSGIDRVIWRNVSGGWDGYYLNPYNEIINRKK